MRVGDFDGAGGAAVDARDGAADVFDSALGMKAGGKQRGGDDSRT